MVGIRFPLYLGVWGYLQWLIYIRVRGVPARDISSLRALGPGGGRILRDVRAACALIEPTAKPLLFCMVSRLHTMESYT